jgi:hypothetical protein
MKYFSLITLLAVSLLAFYSGYKTSQFPEEKEILKIEGVIESADYYKNNFRFHLKNRGETFTVSSNVVTSSSWNSSKLNGLEVNCHVFSEAYQDSWEEKGNITVLSLAVTSVNNIILTRNDFMKAQEEAGYFIKGVGVLCLVVFLVLLVVIIFRRGG